MPLLMCGPILRRVEPDAVTVWLALKEEKKVWLEVYEDTSAFEQPPVLKKLLAGESKTIRLGDNLHITAVTASPVSGEGPLSQGKIYFYNLFFTAANAGSASPGDPNLETLGMTKHEIHYAHEPEDIDSLHRHVHLPSFCLAPDDLNAVRIVHGSCRKAHAEGSDAMPGIDDMILSNRFDPAKRPHYLLLTGDQFYADDIAGIMLYLLMDAEQSVLGSVEDLPAEDPAKPRIGKPVLPNANGQNAHFFRGDRKDVGGFTSHESNHLATVGEYMCYYLFMWSPVLWMGLSTDDEYPSHTVVGGKKNGYDTDLKSLQKFSTGLSRIQRAMANVPIYMIFDDHDVTDDWYMSYHWCQATLSNELGRRMIMNGLLSYALFQDWGNSPERYLTGSGQSLLQAAEAWLLKNTKRDNPSSTADKEPDLQKLLGIPLNKAKPLVPVADYFMIDQDADAMRWDYQVVRNNYEIKFLDGRTRRGYPDPLTAKRKDKAHPDIISEQSMIKQFDHDNILLPHKEVTIVVVPTSLISIPAIEFDEFPLIVRFIANRKFDKDVYEFDLFDHWRNQSKAGEKFLSLLSERNAPLFAEPGEKKLSRVVLLTGDVHFAAASRMEYETDTHKTVFAQVISSSFKKQEVKTRVLHQRGYKFSTLSALLVPSKDLIVGLPEWADKKFGFVGKLPAFAISAVLHIVLVILEGLMELLNATLLKDWFDPKGIDPRHYLGWKDPNQEGITRLLLPLGNGLEKEFKLPTPAVIEKNILNESKEPKLKFPDWQYRIDFIYAANDIREPAPYPVEELTAPGPGDRKESLKNYLALAKNHHDYATKWGNGKEIVGVNNISEIFFEWTDTQKSVRQETWWRLKGNAGELKLFPLSNFKVPLNFNDNNFPLPPMPQPPN